MKESFTVEVEEKYEKEIDKLMLEARKAQKEILRLEKEN